MSLYGRNEWRLWHMSGDYYLDNSNAFSSLHKNNWVWVLWFGELVTQTDIICVAEFVYLCAELHTRTCLNFTFKPLITITFLKFCQNYLGPRNQLWNCRLLPLDQIYFGLFLLGGLCLVLVFFFSPSRHWKPIYIKAKSEFFFGMHILFCTHMWFSCS